MKRWLFRRLGWGLAILMIQIGFINAQSNDDLPTIYDLIKQHPEFRLFTKAIEYDGAWGDLLNNPDAELTVFIPTDLTFRDGLDQLGQTEKGFLQQTDALNEWLTQSIVPMAIDYDVLLDYPLTYVMTMLDERGLLIQHINEIVYINSSRVDNRYYASNGIVYLLTETILTVPPPLFEASLSLTVEDQSLLSYLATADDLTLFHELVLKSARWKHLLMDETQRFTIFTPHDEALQAYLEENPQLNLNRDQEALEQFINRHIITGTIAHDTIRSAVLMLDEIGFHVLNLNTAILTMEYYKDGLIVNGIPFLSDGDKVQGGMIYLIDGVIE